MENASKALLMAGGVMLTMLVVSLLMYGWGTMSEYQAELDRIKEIENITKFNQQFTNYERNDVLGYELLSLVNKVIDYNQRHSKDYNSTSSAGNEESYESIDIKISMGSDLKELRGSIEIPTKPVNPTTTKRSIIDTGFYAPPTTLNNSQTLFKEDAEYNIVNAKQSQDFEDKVLKVVKAIENPAEELNPQFGGPTGIQNLIKNMGTIYSGAIVRYNGIPENTEEAKSWYDENYIISRYKTLTGVKMLSVQAIREESNIIKVLQYYEYSQFKKASFKCTEVKYDDNTGRVISMNFEYKGLE